MQNIFKSVVCKWNWVAKTCENGNFEKSIDLLRKAQCLNESLVSLIKQSDIDQALNSVMVKSLNSI